MSHTKRLSLLPLLLPAAAVLLIAACQTMNTGGGPSGPSVSVRDQSVAGGTVTVARVVSEGPGWLMIHAQANGGPGPILGNAEVKDGVNRNVKVTIDLARATPVLYAMLHTDAGQVGVLEFPARTLRSRWPARSSPPPSGRPCPARRCPARRPVPPGGIERACRPKPGPARPE